MKFFDFGSLGFYRFFDFQKYLNFSIFRYSLINYYSYREQSNLINDANLLKDKIIFLERIYKDSNVNSKNSDLVKTSREAFSDAFLLIKKLVKKYYPSSEILNISEESLFEDKTDFNKFTDKLRYLNFKVDLRHKIENFERKNKNPYFCIRISTFFIKEELFERLNTTIDFFSNEANNNNLEIINKEIDEYYQKVEQIKKSEDIKESHKKYIIDHTKDKIAKILKDHSLDLSKLLIKMSLLDITLQSFESYYSSLFETLQILSSVNNIIEIGLDELPEAIFNDWTELIYLKRKEFQKMVLLSDYIFQKRIISTINSGGWKFTFFTLAPRQGDIFQLSIDTSKNFDNIEDAIRGYKQNIQRFNILKLEWETNISKFDYLFENVF